MVEGPLLSTARCLPKLIVNIIGVFMALSWIGEGTIIGSAGIHIFTTFGVCLIASGSLMVINWFFFVKNLIFYLAIIIFFSCSGLELYPKGICIVLYFVVHIASVLLEPIVEKRLGRKKQDQDVEEHAKNGEMTTAIATDEIIFQDLLWSGRKFLLFH